MLVHERPGQNLDTFEGSLLCETETVTGVLGKGTQRRQARQEENIRQNHN
jgi:hypothetical protein